LDAGASIYFVQQQLDHKNTQTTIDLYGRPDQAADRDAAARSALWWRIGLSEASSAPRLAPKTATTAALYFQRPVTTGVLPSEEVA
jgi:hypothetical protein